MKKRGLLQHALAGTIASMGHTDLLVVADELQVEEAIIADELLARDEVLPVTLQELFPDARFRSVSHDELKRLSARARAIVRTGECTPYHNLILASGVMF